MMLLFLGVISILINSVLCIIYKEGYLELNNNENSKDQKFTAYMFSRNCVKIYIYKTYQEVGIKILKTSILKIVIIEMKKWIPNNCYLQMRLNLDDCGYKGKVNLLAKNYYSTNDNNKC